jgi:Arc/MetJ-type ribon-helix-helix transcriptional regulator
MTKTGRYTKRVWLQITPEMYQFVALMADRQRSSVNDVIRQAIREYLDVQEDLLGSRSRLGRTVISRLETMQFQLLQQLRHLSKLLLAAMIILMTQKGQDSKQVISHISNLASHPELDKILEPKG